MKELSQSQSVAMQNQNNREIIFDTELKTALRFADCSIDIAVPCRIHYCQSVEQRSGKCVEVRCAVEHAKTSTCSCSPGRKGGLPLVRGSVCY